ncbi:CBS domain-containing protein [Kitasatospora sp. NPDC059571]|uniref:CBS domain-containing protein n=1 Tax=Kitasatospora sp. NPDC059571 TaxID=3346871 RepID=UPI0036AA5F3D
MRHRTVRDVMTTPAVSVAPGTGFREIVAVLDEYGITAVPVVDGDGRPLGVVSEADLLRTEESQEDPTGLRPGPPPPPSAPLTASDLMSAPAVCTTGEVSVVAAARMMHGRGVKRLPVIDADGRLVGVVARADLLRVFLRDDPAIRAEIIEEVLGQVAGVSPAPVGVEVDQGRVVLSGEVARAELAPVLVRLAASVDGVVSVTDRIGRPQPVGP